MKRTYFFNLLKMKMLSIRLIISVFCMVFMNFLVVMPDIRANYDTLDIVYLFRFTYDIGSFSRLLPLLAAFVMADAVAQDFCGYRQVLCANSFTSLAELSLHRAGKPALNYLVAEDRERVKGGEAACEALDVNSVFCYQPASSSCISMCFMLMYFFPPHWVPAT